MKRILSRSAVAVIAIALLLSFGLVATAATLNVPSTDYPTITAALAAANPGDTILVGTGYDGTGETFPIQVQKDNITIKADTGVTLAGEDGKVVFVVGAAWTFNQTTSLYETRRVSGVTIDGFTITNGAIGILVKEADDVTISHNTISPVDPADGDEVLEGIRLVDAKTCHITDNKVIGVDNIGIFIQSPSEKNVLSGNTVSGNSLGLFVFESNDNTVTGDTYNDNASGGVVLNDSTGNTLSGLTVDGNGDAANRAWGVRFVFADSNSLLKSDIRDNNWGGVELLGSDDNTVEGNIVYNNGTANDGSDDAQIVITKGDKATFATNVFDGVETSYNNLGDLSKFVEEKHQIESKLDLLAWWTNDLNTEMWSIRQSIAAAIGMVEENDQTPSINTFIDGIMAQKRSIEEGKIYGTLTEAYDSDQTSSRKPVEFVGTAMTDPAHNFTLQGSTNELASELDTDTDDGGTYNGADFGLDYSGADTTITDDNQISWSKLDLIDILILGIRYEIYNSGGSADSLKEKITDLLAKGLITQQDADALREKLDAALGFLAQIERVKYNDDDATNSLIEKLDKINDLLDAAKTALNGGGYDTAKTNLLDAKAWAEEFIAELPQINTLIADIRYKLCLVDLELPPFPQVNTNLVGKKEKPFFDITADEIQHGDTPIGMKDAIANGLQSDTNAEAVLNAVKLGVAHPTGTPATWGPDDIQVTDHDTKCSTDNKIASNLIMTDISGTDTQIGMIIECGPNKIINNAFTNEKVQPIDTETGYGEFHHMDVAIVLLASNCTIAYNSIEWVDKGIIRGGTWKRNDVQTEYVFAKLAAAAYWPEPGLSRTGCPDPNLPGNPQTTYTGDHFDSRVVVWVPVLSVTSKDVDGIGFGKYVGSDYVYESQRIKHTRIAINFFEYVGTSIDIVDAESNVIDENLFYNCANGILFRKPQTDIPVPGDYNATPDKYSPGGAGPNIVLEKNDYYSGVAIHNDSDLAVDANRDYTSAQGTVGHATIFGNVNPPAAPAPNSYDNFGKPFKYVELAITDYEPDFNSDVVLPPNLTRFYAGVVLPPEKARNPETIFNAPQPTCTTSELLPAGWNLVSVPVIPVDPSPAAVFGDDVPFLYIWEWDAAQEKYVIPTEIKPGRAYWIYLQNATTLDVCGATPTEDYEVALGAAGWHMVSTPTICVYWQYVQFKHDGETKNLADAYEAGWIRPFFYPYDVVATDYETLGASASDLMCAWPGYWFKTLVDGVTMVLPIAYSLNNPPVPPMSLRPMGLRTAGDVPPAHPTNPSPTSVDQLVVMNSPNPVRDVHTTTFKVMGGFVEAIRVQIFDQSGKLVFEDENPGNELSWHTENNYGENLANGVYLYQVSVKIAGQWNVTKVQKLAIYR